MVQRIKERNYCASSDHGFSGSLLHQMKQRADSPGRDLCRVKISYLQLVAMQVLRFRSSTKRVISYAVHNLSLNFQYEYPSSKSLSYDLSVSL